SHIFCSCVFFNAPSLSVIYSLSLHDALPILRALSDLNLRSVSTMRSSIVARTCSKPRCRSSLVAKIFKSSFVAKDSSSSLAAKRSEEHTSELQSPYDLVCRLLLEKKNKNIEN